MKTTKELYDQHERISRLIAENARRKAREAHPETNGEPLLVHNWGNAEAKAAWREQFERAQQIREVYRHLYTLADHKEHTAQGFKPIYCQYCN